VHDVLAVQLVQTARYLVQVAARLVLRQWSIVLLRTLHEVAKILRNVLLDQIYLVILFEVIFELDDEFAFGAVLEHSELISDELADWVRLVCGGNGFDIKFFFRQGVLCNPALANF